MVSIWSILPNLSHPWLSVGNRDVEVRSGSGESAPAIRRIALSSFSPDRYPSAWGVTNRGEIVMQGLPFLYPEDPSVRQVSDEYLFGDSLLVSPVTEPHATSRTVVLPAADSWIDFWSGKTYRGGQTITVDAPLEPNADPGQSRQYRASGPGGSIRIRTSRSIGNQNLWGQGRQLRVIRRQRRWLCIRTRCKGDHPLRVYRRHTLSIGDRAGSFPGMLAKRTFRIVFVQPGSGVGGESNGTADRSVTYNGRSLKIDLGKKS